MTSQIYSRKEMRSHLSKFKKEAAHCSQEQVHADIEQKNHQTSQEIATSVSASTPQRYDQGQTTPQTPQAENNVSDSTMEKNSTDDFRYASDEEQLSEYDSQFLRKFRKIPNEQYENKKQLLQAALGSHLIDKTLIGDLIADDIRTFALNPQSFKDQNHVREFAFFIREMMASLGTDVNKSVLLFEIDELNKELQKRDGVDSEFKEIYKEVKDNDNIE